MKNGKFCAQALCVEVPQTIRGNSEVIVKNKKGKVKDRIYFLHWKDRAKDKQGDLKDEEKN